MLSRPVQSHQKLGQWFLECLSYSPHSLLEYFGHHQIMRTRLGCTLNTHHSAVLRRGLNTHLLNECGARGGSGAPAWEGRAWGGPTEGQTTELGREAGHLWTRDSSHKWESYRSRNKHAPLQSHFRNKPIFSVLWRHLNNCSASLSQSQLYEQSLKTNLRL